jgi:phospholipid/cholesterol/gamma-HCH transport system substrate-binding protein
VVTRAPSFRSIAVALSFVLSCVGLIVFVWVQFGGSVPFAAQGYRVRAVFNETGLLVPNADVRIAGVNVGKVVSVSSEGEKSLVTLDLVAKFAPIPADTRAILREKTLLGEAYVELSTGNRSGPKLRDGGTIPNDQVEATQQLDQILNAFTKPVQQDFEQFLDGTGVALKGQGQNLNDAFGNFDPAATELDDLAGILNAQGSSLSSVIRDSGKVLTALGDRGSELQSLIGSGDRLFTATSVENRSLTKTIDALPPFLTQVKATLVKLNTTLGIAKPSLDALRPVAPLLKPALVNLTALSGPVVSLLKRAPVVLRTAETDVPKVTTFVNGLQPVADSLLPAAEQLVPVINIVADYRQQLVLGMTDLADILNGQTTGNTTSDALGVPTGQAKYLRQVLTLGPDTFFGQTSRSPAIRTNTYFAPNALASIGKGGEPSATCAGTGSGNVPCTLQPAYDWGHGITSSYYPHVTAAGPSGQESASRRP